MIFQSYVSKVKELVRKGKEEDALKILLEREKRSPNDIDLLIEIARLYFKIGELNNTKRYLNKVCEMDLKEKNIKEILEITNHFMISSFNYFNNFPAFSSDGSKIVFTSARRDTNNDGKINIFDRPGIYVYSIDNQTEDYIVSDEYYNISPVLSPDGEKLLYLSIRRDTNHDGVVDYRDNAGLYIVDLRRGVEEELVSDEHKVKNPSFSPDGKNILFSCWLKTAKASGIYMMNLKTKEMKTVVSATYESTFPSFSPDGKKILFVAWRMDTNGDGNITIMDNSGIYIKDLETELELGITGHIYNNSFPSFSPDGGEILYLSVRRDTNQDGYINNLDNAGIYIYDLKRKKERILQPDTQYNKFASFSSDGKNVIFLSSWAGYKLEHRAVYENKGIYCCDIYGRNLRQIVCEKYYGCRSPVISLRNDIVYLSWRKGTNRGLFMTNLDKLPTKEQLKTIIERNL